MFPPLKRIFRAQTEALEPHLQEIDAILHALEKGEMECAMANSRLKTIAKVFSIENWHQAIKRSDGSKPLFTGEDAYKACGVFNLLGEIIPMTRFENTDSRAFYCARQILNHHLKAYSTNKYWGELVARRGPIEGMSKINCGMCGFKSIEVCVSGFLGESAVFCDTCGAMCMAPLACEDHEKFFKACAISNPHERAQMANTLGVTVPNCPCGGIFMQSPTVTAWSPSDPAACPSCGHNSIERISISSYQYFKEHQWYRLRDLLDPLK